jgi:membrane dipeptidase
MRIALALLLAPVVLGAQAPDPNMTRALRLMREAPFIDTHNDLPEMLLLRGGNDLEKYDPNKPLPNIDTDLPRLKAGRVGGQFWAAYVPSAYEGKGAAHRAIGQIDVIHRMIARNPDLAYATTAADIVRLHKLGKTASLIGIEGGHAMENSMAMLRQFYALGVRYMTLTHGSTTAWADASTDSARHGGLTAFGEEVVREMNRLGMMVDISHVSDGVMSDVARVSEAPLFFSHSSARALADHPRNAPDSILALLEEKDGVIMINAFPAFVHPEGAKILRDIFDKERELRAQFPNDQKKADSAFVAYISSQPIPHGDVKMFVDHIEHVRKVAGIDHVGIGADLGTLDVHPDGLEDVSKFPAVVAEMLRRGWPEEDVKKVMGGNLLRVMQKTEEVAARLQKTRQPSAKTIEELDGAKPKA